MMVYRQEIDSVRAVAVVSVLLFHHWPNLFPTGFLGVDIFFVISGYLISSQILENWHEANFTFRGFYFRRIRRILPATLFIILASALIGTFILIGHDYRAFLKSILSSLFFVSNIFFWRDGGYFGGADSLKPLLNLWSLSVEEQFYIGFPAFFLCVLKFGRRYENILIIVALIIILSLMANISLIKVGGATPAFFLTPFRCWQFGFGTLAACVYRQFSFPHSAWTMLGVLSFAVVGMSFGTDIVAPGFWITFGVGAFLACRYQSSPIFDILFLSRSIRYMGLISFSLYLWHWPLLAFLRYIEIDEPSNLKLSLSLLSSFAMANLTYWFIEKPFRNVIRPRVTLLVTGGGTIALLIGLTVTLQSQNLFQRDDLADRLAAPIQTNFRCGMFSLRAYGGSRACVVPNSSERQYQVALVGNSHAQMYAPAIEKILQDQNEPLLVVPLNGCLPTLIANISVDCLRLARANFDAVVSDANVKTIIFAMTWESPELEDPNGVSIDDRDMVYLFRSVMDLVDSAKATGRKVYIVGPILTPNVDLASVLSRRVKFGHLSEDQIDSYLQVPRDQFDRKFSWIIAQLNLAIGNDFLRPSDFLCDIENCYFGRAHNIYFADGNHLSHDAVVKLSVIFLPVMAEVERHQEEVNR